MRKILTLTMSGLVTVLPLALTVYVIWWLVHTVEGWLRRALIALRIVSPEHYWPGLGLIAGFLLLLLVGSLVNAYAGKILLKYWDDFLGRIPFVKTLYGGFRDVVSLLPVRQRREARSAARGIGAIRGRARHRFRHSRRCADGTACRTAATTG